MYFAVTSTFNKVSSILFSGLHFYSRWLGQWLKHQESSASDSADNIECGGQVSDLRLDFHPNQMGLCVRPPF